MDKYKVAKTNDILFLHCFDGDFLDDEPAPVLEPQYGDHFKHTCHT